MYRWLCCSCGAAGGKCIGWPKVMYDVAVVEVLLCVGLRVLMAVYCECLTKVVLLLLKCVDGCVVVKI